jgi:putative acyl-CoA dehydrogenase
MAMTEKQGGTDVRANTTYAYPIGEEEGPGADYEIVGHKWFCSAPMCDAFLTLAQTESGLSCFLLPRWRPDGTRNEFYIQRLKDKMGNKSNASSEVEFRGAYAQMLGEEGRGVPTIIEMVSLTRFDCMIGSTSLMRQAVAQVTHHIAHRSVMGAKLIDQPLMQNVAADLCLEVEGALAMTARVARALDNQTDPAEAELIRLTTAVGKYWICKRATHHIGEAQECLGGIGYVEESILSRLYREAPVNSIWEGSGNVQCLDVLRAMSKTPQVVEVYFNELNTAAGHNALYDSYIEALKNDFTQIDDFMYQGRFYVERLAKAMQAAQLIKSGNTLISEAFCASRLDDIRGLSFGNLPKDIDCKAIIERARPKL